MSSVPAPPRASRQVAIAPPAPSETSLGQSWTVTAVESGTFTSGLCGQAASAGEEATTAKEAATSVAGVLGTFFPPGLGRCSRSSMEGPAAGGHLNSIRANPGMRTAEY